jgi:PAS domain S-box-containing protein
VKGRPAQTRPAARADARPRGVAFWLLLALLLQAALAIIDASSTNTIVFTAMFVLAPFAVAVAGNARATAIAGVMAVLLAIASGAWNDYSGTANHLVRITFVAAGSTLAVLAAAAIERAGEQRARMSVLASIGRMFGAERVEDAVEGLADALVPAVGDGCWIDVDGRRLFEHGAPARPPTQVTAPRLADDGATALLPLHTFGALGLASTGTRYDEDDLAFLEILAGRVALVLANARLVTDLRSTRARLDGILSNLAEAVTVHDEGGKTVFANAAAARLFGCGSPDEVIAAEPGEIAGRFAISAEDGSPVSVDDFPGRRLVAGKRATELLTRSINLQTGQARWLLTKATLLEDQGRTYAINVIEDVTDAKEAELRQRFLARAGQLLASSLDYQQTLQSVANLAVPWLADWCAVDMPDDRGQIQQVAFAHADPSRAAEAVELRRRSPPDPDADSGVGALLAGGPPQLIEDIADAPAGDELDAARALGARSVMRVPMRTGDTTLGVLTLGSGHRYTADDFAFAQDLALRAATAVQNARLYEEQARVAQTLQASLLPERLPHLPGWIVAASYRAGEQGADVGGDFYDIVAADGGRQLVFLGDVTGKGIEAAALTSQVRHSLRTAARFDPRPGPVLRLVNEILVEQPRLSPVTLACALLEGSRMVVAAAGHPPPLLRRAGKVVEIGPNGVLLGAVTDCTYREETVELRPGDTILLFTDGVTETPGAGERFGADRLVALLAAAPEEPDAILAEIEAALDDFQTTAAVDDRAMLVLRYTGAPDSNGAR